MSFPYGLQQISPPFNKAPGVYVVEKRLMEELDSVCQASEAGKALIADTVWEKQVKEELGLPDL